MKIIPTNTRNIYTNSSESIKNDLNTSKDAKVSNRSKSFDEIIIKAKTNVSDEKFISDITATISKELKTPTPSNKLAELKIQIAEGTYQIGVNEIINKIFPV